MSNPDLTNYWLKGPIKAGDEFLVAAIPRNQEAVYFLTFSTEKTVAGADVPNFNPSGIPLLVFDPQPFPKIKGKIAKAKFTSMSKTMDFQMQFTNAPTSTGNMLGLGYGLANKETTPKIQLAKLSSTPSTFKLKERTDLAVPSVRAEGWYEITSVVDGSLVKVAWLRFPASIDHTGKIVGIQNTARGVPYIKSASTATDLEADSLLLTFIPVNSFADGCTPVGDISKIVSKAHAYIEFLHGRSARPSNTYTDEKECKNGGWYKVCKAKEKCGQCYGVCSNGSPCSVQYDKEGRKIKYACGKKLNKKTPWYETWWILLLIAVVIVVIIIIILMLVQRNKDNSTMDIATVEPMMTAPPTGEQTTIVYLPKGRR